MRLEHWFYTLPLRVRSLLHRSRVEQELDEELEIHLEQLTAQLIAHRQTPEEARFSALRAIGGVEQLKEECRDSRRVGWLQDLAQDLTYAARTLSHKPGFTFTAALVLVFGIGASTAVFTVVNGVLLRPLPYPEADRLVLVSCAPKSLEFDPGPIMVDRDYLEFRRQSHSFESLAHLGSSQGMKVTLTGNGEPAVLQASAVGPDILRVLRVHPSLGREFLPQGKSDAQVVLLSDRIWRSRFDADPGIVGKAIRLNGVGYSVTGVMPASFRFQNADLWVRDELGIDPHNIFFVPVVGRLKPGVSAQQAQAEVSTFAARLPQRGFGQNGFAARILPLRELFVGDVRTLLQIFAGAVAFVFLIACGNFANLLLIRGAGRQPEIAVRAALGASRWRLIRQLLAESTLLSCTGALLGLLLSVAGVPALLALLPAERIPSAGSPHLDMPVLLFTIGLSLLTGVVFGLAPAWQATRRELRDGVTEGGRNVLGRREWLRGVLVSAEIALALILLAGAGLLVKSFLRMRSVNPGFQADRVTVATIDLPPARYRTVEQMRSFDQRVLAAMHRLPGADSVAAVSFLPFGFGVMGDFQIEDGRHLPADFRVDKPEVSPDYFRAMRIPIMSGRAFTAHDDLSAPGVVIVSESVARRLWPGRDAIGKRISMEDHPKAGDWLTIIGVAGNVRQQGLSDQVGAVVYQPYAQIRMPGFISHMSFVARTEDPQATARQLRDIIHRVDKDLPTESVTAMGAIIDEAMSGAASQTRLLAIFSGVALLIAAIGIYGVLACSVAERTHEIGIRMALGADQNEIIGMIFRRTLVLTGSGVIVGVLGALAVTGVLRKLLFEVKPGDPATFAVVIAILISAALLAAWVPARRAARVLPAVALRHE